MIRGVRCWSHIIGGKVSSGPLTYYGSLSSLLTHTLPYPQTVNAPRPMKNNSYLRIPWPWQTYKITKKEITLCGWVGDWSGYGLMLRWGTKYYLPWLLPLLWVPTSQHTTKNPKHKNMKNSSKNTTTKNQIYFDTSKLQWFSDIKKGAVPINLKIPKRNSLKNLKVRDQSNTPEVSKNKKGRKMWCCELPV